MVEFFLKVIAILMCITKIAALCNGNSESAGQTFEPIENCRHLSNYDLTNCVGSFGICLEREGNLQAY